MMPRKVERDKHSERLIKHRDDIGMLLSSVSKNIVLEDNKEHSIAHVYELCNRKLESLCCKKRVGGRMRSVHV